MFLTNINISIFNMHKGFAVIYVHINSTFVYKLTYLDRCYMFSLTHYFVLFRQDLCVISHFNFKQIKTLRFRSENLWLT